MLKLVEVYRTVDGLPALVTTAQDDEHRVLPPFELEIALGGWWLPGPPPTSNAAVEPTPIDRGPPAGL